MSRMKTAFAALVVAAMAAVALPVFATTDTIEVVAAGSSAIWQTLGLAAYNAGSCPKGTGIHPPCLHYTDNTKFNLNDTRPTLNGLGGTVNQDPGDLWIVWDSPTGTQKRNVWVFLKVDSIVGDRCFYASPKCTIAAPSGYVWSPGGGLISSSLWGADTVPPADVQALFAGNGVTINSSASDIRPEDALFEECRVNSLLGNGGGGGFGDGLDGLGYGSNSSGTCPQFGAALSQLVGSPIKSGISGSSATANVLAFNLTGTDPFTNQTIAAPSILNVGAVPVVFVFSRSTTVNAGLNGATNITDAAAQTVFSGANCDANVIDSSIAAGTAINVYLREPLSGTMTTTEMSVFRRPTKTVPPQAVLGVSQEKNVGGTNPLSGTACVSGTGARTRGIGTGEVVNGKSGSGGVLNSGGSNLDGIAYAFFSFGNFSKISNNSKYGYLTLDGVDPIGPLAAFPNQELPSCTAPCTEASIWGSAGTSFPQLRAGNYSAWSTIRLITTTGSKTAATNLVTGSNVYAAGSTPDYIPATAVTTGANTDPGMQIWHTHYQQRDGNDAPLGGSPKNGTFSKSKNPVGGDVGGDAGGCTIKTPVTETFENNFIQSGPGVASCTKDRD